MAIKSETLTIQKEDGQHTFTAVQLPATRALKFVTKLSDLGILSSGDPAKTAAAVMSIAGQTELFDMLLSTVTLTANGRNMPMNQALFDAEFSGSLKQAVEFIGFAIKVQIADFLADNPSAEGPA